MNDLFRVTKKLSVIIIMLILIFQSIRIEAQQTITIGNGIYSYYPLPVRPSMNYGWSAVIYPQSLMQNSSGYITKLAYLVENNLTMWTAMQNQKIYLKVVQDSNFSNTQYISPSAIGADLVFDGSISWNGPGWDTITLDNKFIYNGGHLLVLFENHYGSSYNSPPKFKSTYHSSSHKSKHRESSFSFYTGSGYYEPYYPDIQITFMPFDSNNIAADLWVLPTGDILPSASQTMKVRIKNIGSVSQDTMLIKYSIDNGTTFVIETINDSIAAFDTLVYTFNTVANLTKMKHYFGTAVVKNSGDTITSDDSLSFDFWVGSALSGSYSIGSSPANDFQTLSDAVDVLEHFGMSSSIVFELDAQNFNEQITINGPITGLSISDTIIIKGQGANNTTISFAPNPNTNIFTLSNISNITIDSIGILSTLNSGSYYGLSIIASNNINVRNCHIAIPSTSLTGINGVLANNANHFKFINNTVEGGYQAMGISGTTSDLKVVGNRFIDFYHSGVYSSDQGNAVYFNNSFSDIGLSYSITALSINNHINGAIVSNNKIISNATNSTYGLRINNCQGVNDSDAFIISNNMISVLNGSSSSLSYGIFWNSGKYIHLYNNTVLMSASCGQNSKDLYIQNNLSTTSFTNNKIKNNIFSHYGNGYAIAMLGGVFFPTNITEIDYNNLYTVGSKFVATNSYSNLYTDLASWQASASGLETHSISTDPFFVSNNDLHSNSSAMSNLGLSLTEVTHDIDGDIRSAVSPDIGADEYTPIVLSLNGNHMMCYGDSVLISSNLGSAYNYLWTLNGDTLLTSNPTVLIDTAGVLTVEVSSSPQMYDTITISEIPLPIVYLGADTSIMKTYGSITLDAGNPSATWLWSNGAVTQTQFFTNVNLQLAINNIWVKVTENSCSATDTIVVNVIDDTSIRDKSNDNGVIIFPNPNNGVFNLKVGEFSGDLLIEIIDISGKVVFKEQLIISVGDVAQFNVKLLPKGIYTVRVIMKNRVESSKINIY